MHVLVCELPLLCFVCPSHSTSSLPHARACAVSDIMFSLDLCAMTVAGEAESAGKGILSAVMNRITGSTDKASDKASDGAPGTNGAEAKQADSPERKSVPELQASLPPVATRCATLVAALHWPCAR